MRGKKRDLMIEVLRRLLELPKNFLFFFFFSFRSSLCMMMMVMIRFLLTFFA